VASRRLRFAVIPTRDRPEDFADCVRAIAPQVGLVIAIDHRSGYVGGQQPVMACVGYDEDLPNISRMWNLGLTTAHELAEGRPYDVAVLNDDVIVPPDWFDRVADTMHKAGAVAGCIRRTFDPRMTGYAFILNGDAGLLADEQFQWWYGDDDLRIRAEAAGGVAYAYGEDVEHRHPNSTTVGELASIAAQDRERFERKWNAANSR
jgi:hypothetical protein